MADNDGMFAIWLRIQSVLAAFNIYHYKCGVIQVCKYKSHNNSDNNSLYAPFRLLSNDKSDGVSQFIASKLQSCVPKGLGVAGWFVLCVGPTLKIYIRQNNKQL